MRIAARSDWKSNPRLKEAQAAVERALGDACRVLIRASGTEPVLRVMVEARDRELADSHAEAIAQTIARAAGQRL